MRYLTQNRITRGGASSENEEGTLPPNPAIGISKIQMRNKSILRLEKGYIVRLEESLEYSVTTFPQYNPFQPHPFGIVLTPGDPDDQIEVAYGGIVDVEMDTAQVRIGDYLYNSGTPGLLISSDSGFIGALGRALTAKPNGANGRIKALIGYLPNLG